MSDEYTPGTDYVRHSYVLFNRTQFRTDAVADAEFDRWRDKDRAEAQVEALRDLAAAHYLDGPQSTYNTIMRRANNIAREAGIKTGEKADCDPHNLVQHRDMKPPWCNKCGRDASRQMQRKEQDDA